MPSNWNWLICVNCSPALKKLSLAGTVDMDLDVYIPYAAATNSRLNGMLATRNLNFQLAHMAVEKGDSEFNLTGQHRHDQEGAGAGQWHVAGGHRADRQPCGTEH